MQEEVDHGFIGPDMRGVTDAESGNPAKDARLSARPADSPRRGVETGDTARISIGIVVFDGVQALDVVGPLDVFAEANRLVPGRRQYTTTLVGRSRAPLRASNGMILTPEDDFASASRLFGTVLVAGGPDLPEQPGDADTLAWLRDWATKAGRYGSVCTGAFTLGHAGLLDGRTVTTHWENAARLATMFPEARVERDRIYLRDGALVTSAGVTAGIDLALALVAEDHGAEIALACAKRLVVVAQRQGGQSQFSPLLVAPPPPGSPLAKVQSYVMEHRGEALSVGRLAAIAGVSVRTLARLFGDEFGATPHQFVEAVRIDLARNLLEATNRPLKSVAFDCGFGTPEQMRDAFRRRLGTTPSRYRETFGTMLPDDACEIRS